MNQLHKSVASIILFCFLGSTAFAQDTLPAVSSSFSHPIHRIELEAIPSAILHTNKFLRGANFEGRTMNHAFTARLKYGFELPHNSLEGQIYRGTYQGIGLAYHEFNPQLGNPVSVFLYQGSPIVRLSKRLSFNYEWNFGLTYGWNPYDEESNPDNKVIGSKATAYMDLNFILQWRLAHSIDLHTGFAVTHFSNGNTRIPNKGLNIAGVKLGLTYYPNRERLIDEKPNQPIPALEKHLSYDLVFFGAWKRQGYYDEEEPYALPGSFGVFGFNFNPMYNLNYRFKTGLSLDGVYDHSANLILSDYADISQSTISYPSVFRQMALGLSARAEFVMPFYSINFGVGRYFLNGKGIFSGFYQTLALKMNLSRNSFVHIGYSLQSFRHPNHLMLGMGFRFHNKRQHF